MSHPDPDLIALGIRQPWAELIMQGVKTIEVRTVPIAIRGCIYVYASRQPSDIPAAQQAIRQHELDLAALPTVRVIGTVEILDCRRCTPADEEASLVPADQLKDRFAWVMGNAQRLPESLPPAFRPFGIWFYPFKRKSDG